MGHYKLKTKGERTLQYALSALSMLVLVSDRFTSLGPTFALVGYFTLIYLVIQLVDFRRLAILELSSIALLSSSVAFVAMGSNGDLTIALKYLLLFWILSFSFFKKRFIEDSHLLWMIKVPLLVIVVAGACQLFLMLLSPGLIIPYLQGHFRPIGLSVEPTFYSQQLVFLWILSDLCGLNKGRGKRVLELLIVLLILACATRTSMLAMVVFLLFRSSLKTKFVLIFSGALGLPYIFATFDGIGLVRQLGDKVANIFSISGEPREVALMEMLTKVQDLPIFGHGFLRLESSSGLETGALYANLFIAITFSMGILSFVPFLFLFLRIISSSNITIFMCCSLVILFSLVMPFLYTTFGMFVFLSLFSVLGTNLHRHSYSRLQAST